MPYYGENLGTLGIETLPSARENYISRMSGGHPDQLHDQKINRIISEGHQKQDKWESLGGPNYNFITPPGSILNMPQYPVLNERNKVVPGWLEAGITNRNLNGYKVMNAMSNPLEWMADKYYDYRMGKEEEEAAKERRRFYDLPGSKLMQYQNPHTREWYTQDEYFPPEHPIWDEELDGIDEEKFEKYIRRGTLQAEASGDSFDAMRHELFKIGIDPSGMGDDEIRQIYDINIGGTTGAEDQYGITTLDPQMMGDHPTTEVAQSKWKQKINFQALINMIMSREGFDNEKDAKTYIYSNYGLAT